MPLAPSYTFKKVEKLCLKRDIDQLFQKGKRLFSKPLIVVYSPVEIEEPPHVQVLVVVPKKHIRRAVHRNTLKRRLREIYRLNKLPLLEAMETANQRLHMAIIYNTGAILSFAELEAEMLQILKKLTSRLQEKNNPA